MKNKILKLSLALLLIFAVLFTLTACNDEDEDKKKSKDTDSSSAQSVIESLVDAVNDQDASAICDLIDIEALESAYGEDIDKKELKSTLKVFFKNNDDLEIKLGKIKSLKKDDELLDSLLDHYDSYEDYVDEIKSKYDVKNLEIYTAELEVSDDYEYIFEDCEIPEGKDLVFLTKKDGKYKVAYTLFAVGLISEQSDYDYDYYDDDKDTDTDKDKKNDKDDKKDTTTTKSSDAKAFNDNFEKYDGKQTGENVKKLVDSIIKNQTDDHPVYITYYAEDGTIDEIMINKEENLKSFKNKIDNTHKYTVESEEDYEGFIRYIDITY